MDIVQEITTYIHVQLCKHDAFASMPWNKMVCEKKVVCTTLSTTADDCQAQTCKTTLPLERAFSLDASTAPHD